MAIAAPDGTVLVSSDPTLVAERLPVGDGRRSWGGAGRDGPTWRRWRTSWPQVPVQPARPAKSSAWRAVGRRLPLCLDRLLDAVPNLLIYLGVASALGLVGSVLLARRVKRQTLGMEPAEIAALVEHREALLTA